MSRRKCSGTFFPWLQIVFDFLIPDLERGSDSAKYFGGRIVEAGAEKNVSFEKAVAYLWISGRVPEWINLRVKGVERGAFHLEIRASPKLAPATGPWRFEGSDHAPFHVLDKAFESAESS